MVFLFCVFLLRPVRVCPTCVALVRWLYQKKICCHSPLDNINKRARMCISWMFDWCTLCLSMCIVSCGCFARSAVSFRQVWMGHLGQRCASGALSGGPSWARMCTCLWRAAWWAMGWNSPIWAYELRPLLDGYLGDFGLLGTQLVIAAAWATWVAANDCNT